MKPNRPSIPIQVQAYRRRRGRSHWPWTLVAALIALLLIWLVSRPPDESSPQPLTAVSAAQVDGPPWLMGNPENRFMLTLYANLECPFYREYSRRSSGGWAATPTWHCNGTTCHWPRTSLPHQSRHAWRNVPPKRADMPRSGKSSSGSIPIRAAMARACPTGCSIPNPCRPLSSAWQATGQM